MGSVRSVFWRKWLDKHALKDVSLRIGEGEIVGMVGTNGAGKTTLVKLLAGIIHPTSGEAQVLGHTPWERKNAFRKQIALIMGQKAQLWWDLPAADCFLLLREIYQIPKKQFQDTLDFLVATLQVEKQLKIQIRRLSLGERMKMELIAALLHHPRVVFLDEPTIGLDFSAQRAIREFILNYRREHRPAMILTSHYMDDIEQLCERVLLIREGEIIYDGSLREILQKHASHKLISAHLSVTLTEEQRAWILEIPDGLGVIDHSDPMRLQLKAPRSRTADAASYLLQKFPVADLNVEDEEIGAVITSFLRGSER